MKLFKTKDIDFYYITEDKDINQIISFCFLQKEIALDTETYVDLTKINPSALDPHSSKISLVQLNSIDNSCPYILDFLILSEESKSLFNKEILLNKNIRKILHYAQFDIKQFYNEFKEWPVNMWCTQTLMKSLAITTGMKASLFRGHSLKDLSRDYFDIDLDKTEATSNWGERPLFIEQLAYAALDVGAPKIKANINSIILEAYFLFKDQLDLLDQEYCYTIDQHAVLTSAKMEYEGMFVDKNVLHKIHIYANEQSIKHRKYLVEELGFTIYTDTILNEKDEWEVIEVIPDKIKVLLNNNKGLVKYINNKLEENGGAILSSLQAEEINIYLDNLESEKKENVENYSDEYIDYKYESISLIKNLLAYKKYNKFTSECLKYFDIINDNTNRIHAGFNSIGSSSGRMSSSGAVNLQQISNVGATIQINKNEF